jgi:Carboxypeptidase regulatory-like domain
MKPTKTLIAFYLFSALLLNCRGQVSGSTESASPQSDTGAQAASNRQHCAVAGSVVSAVTEAPLNKASVRLLRLAEGSGSLALGSFAATTGSSGRFQMLVEPGRYAMVVTRNGYAKQTLGMAGLSKAASTITLACGPEAIELRFLMTPQGLIIGTVADEDHEAVANATVEAFSYRAVSQSDHTRAAGFARTDDLGKYRIFGVPPGRYYVKVQVPDIPDGGGATAREKQQTSYVATYYPGTDYAWAAVPIQVMSGQEDEADITIAKVPTVHVAGKLLSDSRVSRATIVAYPGEHPSWDLGDRHVTEIDDKTGTWMFDGLQPGLYTLVCDHVDGGVRIGARLAVTVGSKNIDNLEMTLSRYPELAGKVTVAGGGKAPPTIKISLQPRQALASMGYGTVRPGPDGVFFLKVVSPDLSDLTVSNLPSGYFVKSVLFLGREVSGAGIELGLGGSHTVNIVLSPNGATLEGSVSNAQGEPSQGATVVLVPEPGRRHQRSSFYTATTGQNGGFTISGIRPGEYTVVAWDSPDSIDYGDPEAVDAADKQGKILKLEEGERKSLQLRALLPANLLP